MCRSLVSVGWNGQLYDCGFNQMLDIPLGASGSMSARTIWDIDAFDRLTGDAGRDGPTLLRVHGWRRVELLGSAGLMPIALIALLSALLAYANGANDVSKGIATLVGSGVANYRRAILWGTAWTAFGAVAASVFAGAMLATFGAGLPTSSPPAS